MNHQRARLALCDRDFARLQAADLLHARNFILRCAIHDARAALERGEPEVALAALARAEPHMTVELAETANGA